MIILQQYAMILDAKLTKTIKPQLISKELYLLVFAYISIWNTEKINIGIWTLNFLTLHIYLLIC